MSDQYGYIDPNFPNPHGPDDAGVIIYGYTPSIVLAILGACLFGISTLLHSFQAFRYRTWYFSVPIIIGTCFEVVGYAFRGLSANVDPYRITYFVVQYFFIVIAPVLFSASIYAVLSVMINNIGKTYSPIFSPRWIVGIFVTCDVIATGVQVAGAALIGVRESNRQNPSTANDILLAGLAFQVFTFFVYLCLLSLFLWRTRQLIFDRLRVFTFALIAASIMVYLRTCFRLAETVNGLQGTLETHEVFFGCLEFAPVVIAVFIFNIFHPGKWVPRINTDTEKS